MFNLKSRFLAATEDGCVSSAEVLWKFRWLCDRIYARILSLAGYDKVRLGIEYSGIRLFGDRSWEAVTDLERDRTRKLIKVFFLRSSNLSKTLKNLKSEEKPC